MKKETRKETPEKEEKATRPNAGDYLNNKRDRVKYWRACSAYNLAARLNAEPTEQQVQQADSLLNRIIRWSLKRAKQWERANTYEKYGNSERAKQDEEQIEKHGEKLEKELIKYNACIMFYGLYPTITEPNEDGNKNGRDLGLLHYYD